ncbi:MAG: ATP-binding protein [Pseudomonadota bacterium]
MPLAIFWLWPFSVALDRHMEDARGRHLIIAQDLALVLSGYQENLVAAFDAFRGSIADGGGSAAWPLFEHLNVRKICVADLVSGVVRAAPFERGDSCPTNVPAARLPLFQELAAGGGVGFSPVMGDPGKLQLVFLVAREGDALVIGAIDMRFFRDLLGHVSFGEAGHAAIVDHSGRVLAHSAEETGQSEADLSDLEPLNAIRAGQSGVVVFRSPALDQDVIAGVAPVPGVDWGVVVPQPVGELSAAAASYLRDGLLILFFGVILSVALALNLSTLLSQRLSQTATALNRLARQQDGVSVRPGRSIIGIKELLSLETDVNRLSEESTSARWALTERNLALAKANQRLRCEMEDRRRAEIRFRSLFESAPIPIREEDLSGMKRLIDELGIRDPDEFEAYVDAHPEFLTACGNAIVVVDANCAAVSEHGYPDKRELLQKVVRTLSPAAMRIVRMTAIALHAGAGARSYETQIVRANGDVRTVAATWTVIPGHEDTYSRILLTSVDITERLASEAALRQAQKMEAVGQLTGGVAHDVNNLMTVIGGSLELIETEATLDPSHIVPIQNAVRRASDLTQRLLAFSRKQPLDPKPLDLRDLVTGMTDLLRHTLGEDIEIQIAPPSDLWPALADPGQVEAALLNLALNARDAMPEGGHLSIACSNRTLASASGSGAQPGEYAVLSVSDTGAGMSDVIQARAFEPFFTTKEVGKGSGLGLSMVYGFAKQSKGDVVIDSAPGAGTTVSLFLPRSPASPKPTAPTLRTVGYAGRGEKILLLEDDPDVRSYLRRLLTRFGFQALPAEDAATARRIVESGERIDLLISDFMLPGGVRGPEFAAELRAQMPDVGVIFISGRPSDVELSGHPALNGAPLLAKPLQSDELYDVICESLSRDEPASL